MLDSLIKHYPMFIAKKNIAFPPLGTIYGLLLSNVYHTMLLPYLESTGMHSTIINKFWCNFLAFTKVAS